MEKNQILSAISALNSDIKEPYSILSEVNTRIVEAESVVKILNFQINEAEVNKENVLKLEPWKLN